MDWPWGIFEQVQESLKATGELPDDEFIRDWAAKNRWVLLWKKDYWMNADGTVGDS